MLPLPISLYFPFVVCFQSFSHKHLCLPFDHSLQSYLDLMYCTVRYCNLNNFFNFFIFLTEKITKYRIFSNRSPPLLMGLLYLWVGGGGVLLDEIRSITQYVIRNHIFVYGSISKNEQNARAKISLSVLFLTEERKNKTDFNTWQIRVS